MKGTSFPEATIKLLPPEGHEEDVYSLHVWRHPDGGMIISKWHMTWRERLSCLWNGHVWFHCWGNTHPPISIETSCPFEQEGVSWSKYIRPLVSFGAIFTLLVLLGMAVSYLGGYQP